MSEIDLPAKNIHEDYLGLTKYAQALSNFVSTCKTPMTISIQGDWGTGKTSMMNFIQEILSETHTQKIDFIWFNTWKFSQFKMQDNIAFSLLSSFLQDLEESGQNARKLIVNLGRIVLAQSVQFGIDNTFLKAFKDIIWTSENDKIDAAQQVKQLTEEIRSAVTARLAKNNTERLIIFIDDLDRLKPVLAIEVLEVIKNFLDIPGCVFVVAVDQSVVETGLKDKFNITDKDKDSNQGKITNFFEKIIQLTFELPVEHYDTEQYINKLLQLQDKDDSRLYYQLTINSIGKNPRAIKRFFNLLQLRHKIAEAQEILNEDAKATAPQRFRVFFAVSCLRVAYKPIFHELLAHQEQFEQPGYFHTLSLPETKEQQPIEHFKYFMDFFLEALPSDNTKEEISLEAITVLKEIMTGSYIDLASNLTFEDIVQELSAKYQQSLEAMNTQFELWQNNADAGFYFRFILGAMNFRFYLGIESNNMIITLSDAGIASDVKRYARDWFQQQHMADTFPNPEINLRRTWNYIILETQPTAECNTMEVFKNMAIDALDAVLPKLVAFYQARTPIIDKLHKFARELQLEIAKLYPPEEGYSIHEENNFNQFARSTALKIKKATWNNQFSIALEPQGNFLTKLIVGIKSARYKQEYNEIAQNNVYEAWQRQWPRRRSLPWYPFCTDYIVDIASTSDIVSNDFKFAFDTDADERQAIDKIIAELAKFKSFIPQLDQLAQATNQNQSDT
ncbi:hypothetical protein TI05_03000 [Achromatium sp. WMS3]|nr:hypothetical protein TI05_03000 [Achromatium sp. WMS3]